MITFEKCWPTLALFHCITIPFHIKNELWTNGNLLRGVEHPLAYFAAVICVNWVLQFWKSQTQTPGPGMSDLVILESFPRQSYESEHFA